MFSLIIFLISFTYSCEKEIDNDKSLTVEDYDGNVYKTVQIGDQIWMAENLKATHYADGTIIQLVENEADWDALEYSGKAMCYYNDSITNKDIYGALYTWSAAMKGLASSTTNPSNVQGVCPDGWHVPSDDEWKELEMHLGMNQVEADMPGFRGTNEGSKLAGNLSLWDNGPRVNDNELLIDNVDFSTSEFMALPAGHRVSEGSFNQKGNLAVFWSATESGDSLVWTRLLQLYNIRVHRFTYSKKDGYSVRCIKD